MGNEHVIDICPGCGRTVRIGSTKEWLKPLDELREYLDARVGYLGSNSLTKEGAERLALLREVLKQADKIRGKYSTDNGA